LDVAKIPLIAGHPVLNFLNTVEGRGTGDLVNYLTDYPRLAGWAARAGLISIASGQSLARQAAKRPAVAQKAWARAMTLRENLNMIVRAIAMSKPPPSRAAADFNRLLIQTTSRRQLAFSQSGRIYWTWLPGTAPDFEVILRELVLATADLFADLDRTQRIKICANGPCEWVFLDTSRNGLRRWCRMDVCGNVAKVRRFRTRHRSAS
jgi:predicted RNA-binding Zn ribbon-like protein